MTIHVTKTPGYRHTQDIEYTLLTYRRAKEQDAISYATNIRRANPLLEKEFDLVDKQVALIPVDRPEGWDA